MATTEFLVKNFIFYEEEVLHIKKVTWSDIYKEFRQRHPNLRKEATGYSPYDFMKILIYFKDGRNMIYDGLQKRAYFVSR